MKYSKFQLHFYFSEMLYIPTPKLNSSLINYGAEIGKDENVNSSHT